MYMTGQRKVLYEFFASHPHSEFSAKDIYKEIESSGISLSAVYRNLASMTDDGVIVKSVGQGGHETLYRFMKCDGCKNELHLTCTDCGKIFHLRHDVADKLKESIAGSDGFCIDSARTVLYGVCRECTKTK